MVEPGDQEFLRSIFLMEAWDTFAAIEQGITRLIRGEEPAWDELFLVLHRLTGAAALQGFGPDAVEHLETMTAAILTLGREGASEGGIAALFRAVHTLKGAAYVVGCRPIGELAHGLEDVLVTVREGRAALTPAVLEASLAAV